MGPKRTLHNSSDASIRTEFASLKAQFVGLHGQVNDGFASVDRNFAEFRSELKDMANKIAAGQRTPWMTILGALSVFGSLAWFGYSPIQQALVDHKAELVDFRKETIAMFQDLRKEIVPRAEIDARAARSLEDRERIERSIRNLHDEVVPKSAYEERRAAIDRELDALNHRIDRLSDRWEIVHHQ